ncbi:uncharacterized protein LOC124788429 [Schistocerca piceifrons]|uniref:uncharacterized protein LOC124788429 n=1 Tax=Schistocerca piceifrons TaxID=274613 RepID=UPI001F5F4529|nr:uncharacterized protein LOC124788429 [Schistocerca piceifrons]
MPKKASSRNREWERERRERLNNCFKSLESLLPSHNPTASLSKVDIVKKAAEYIRELEKKNANLLEGNTDKECLEQVKLLERRVKELVDYSQLLASLLKAAGISVPAGPGPDLEVLLKRPLKWSGKLSLDQTLQQLAEARQKKFGNNVKKKKNNSRTSGQKTKENVINVEPIPQPSTNTEGNVRSDIVQASTKSRIKSSVKIKKKLKKVPNTVVTVSAPVAHSVIAPANSSTVGPGTLIFTNGTVMPVLSTRVVPLPLLVSRAAKLPIAALTRPVAAHKTRVNHPVVPRSACPSKDVPGTKSKSSSTNRLGTVNATRDTSKNHKIKKNVHLVQKPISARKVNVGGNARPTESLSTEKNGLNIIVYDNKFTLSDAREQAPAHENVGVAPAVETEANTTMLGQEKNKSEAHDDIFDKVRTSHIITTKFDQSVNSISCDKSQQACQKMTEDHPKSKATGDNVDMAEAADVFAKMQQEKCPRSSNIKKLNEDCGGINVNDSHHKSTENIIPTFEINATSGPPFEMQIGNGQYDREMSVSSHSNVDICSGTSCELSTTTSGDMGNVVDCEKVDNVDKPIPLDENKITVETSEITSNNADGGNKRKRGDDDIPESYQLTRKKGKEVNGKTEVNLFTNLSDQESTSKQSCSTSDSVIKSNTKSTVVSTLPSHVSYSVDSLCKTKPLLKTSVTNATSESTQNAGSCSSATSEHSVEDQNASVPEELLDVMNHITSAAKSSVDNDSFNNVLCSSLLQEKYSEKCNLVQNTWLDQSVRQIFNEPDGSRELQSTREHTNCQGTRTVKEPTINEKSDFTLLNNMCPTSQDEQKVDKTAKEISDGSQLTVYESKAQGTLQEGGLSLNTEATPENEKNATDQNSCESEMKARSDYQKVSQEKGFPAPISDTDLNCFSGITSKTVLNEGVPENLTKLADNVRSPTESLAKSTNGQDNTLVTENCQSKTPPPAEKVTLISEELPKVSLDSATNSTSGNSFSDATILFASQLHSEETLNKEQPSASSKQAISYSSSAEIPPVSPHGITSKRTSPSAIENTNSSKSSGAPLLAGTALYKQLKDICTVVSSVTDCVSASSESVSVTGLKSTKPVEESVSYNIQQVSEANSSVCTIQSENSMGSE